MDLEISSDTVLTENAVFLPGSKTLIVADLQIGKEQQLRKHGHNVRYEDAGRMLRLLKKLVKKHDVERLVINGDLKHEFGRISGQERRDVLGMLRKLKREVDIVLVRGNHDTITKPLADELHVPFVDWWHEGDVFCTHGHEIPDVPKDVKTIIIGHVHPAIVLSDGVRREKFKCFLSGKYGGKRLLVLPAFTTLAIGVDVISAKSNTPFLKDFDRCEVYVIADEIRAFGNVKRIKRLSA